MAANYQQSAKVKPTHDNRESISKLDDGVLLAHLGKKEQLKRNFGFFSILALSSTLLGSWETLCSILTAGLLNGGPVSLVYGMLLCISGNMAVAASLSEMASICPIAGAQYHWTSIFAPRRWANFITWIQGWITVFAWQATLTGVTYLAATLIQGLLILNYSGYDPKRWHGTLLMWAIMLINILVNVFAIKVLPLIQLLGGILHLTLFVVLLGPLVALAPQSTNEFVWTASVNESGGYSNGISWCIGLLTITYSFAGFDAAVHMSEEVRNAAVTVPKIMMLSIITNAVLAFGFLIGLLYSVGNIQNALSTPTGYPIIEIFYQATGSTKAATAMIAGIIIILFCAAFGVLASVSRLTWAFARDRGLPFSTFFAYVNPHYHIPIRSIGLVTIVVMLISLINIASSVALNAILSLTTLALYVSYLIPIVLLLLRRIKKKHIEFGPFTLGRFGLFVNIYAIVYGVFIIIFLPFPPMLPVTGLTMNYAGPVFAGVLLFALGDWLVRGRGQFHGPVREVYESEIYTKEEGTTASDAVVGLNKE